MTAMGPIAALHVPHRSALIPGEHRAGILLSDEDLTAELLRMTDWFTDELFDIQSEAGAIVRHPISRLVLDPERFLDDATDVMASRGMGVVYTRTSHGEQLRQPPIFAMTA
jgi:N-formylglutamate amidohydrolase